MTITTTTTAQPSFIPLVHVETVVDSASVDYDGNYNTRYLSDNTRYQLEDELCAVDDEYIQAVTNDFLAEVEANYEVFSSKLGVIDDESFDGIVRGTSTDLEKLREFAQNNVGTSLEQLIRGIDYAGGRVSVRTEMLAEILYDEMGVTEAENWDIDAIERNASRYVIGLDGGFELLPE